MATIEDNPAVHHPMRWLRNAAYALGALVGFVSIMVAAISTMGLLLAAHLFRAGSKESPRQKELIDGHNWK
jgi:hypothetical protein